jgi:hypothetical protein
MEVVWWLYGGGKVVLKVNSVSPLRFAGIEVAEFIFL